MTHRVPSDPRGQRRTRKALLASGALLGLGTATTLAAWTDDVWVAATFTAAKFNIQAAVDSAGTAWREYSDSPGTTLGFTVAPVGMIPGDTVFAPVNLKLTDGEAGAQISLETPPDAPRGSSSDTSFFNALEMTIYQVAPASCNQSGVQSATAISGFDRVPLRAGTGANLVALPGVEDPRGICVAITLPGQVGPEVRGGSTGPLVWTLLGELLP